MKRKIDLSTLKYPFRSLYLLNCSLEGTTPNFSDLKDKVAAASGKSRIRIERLLLTRKGDVMTATPDELEAFATVLGRDVELMKLDLVSQAKEGVQP